MFESAELGHTVDKASYEAAVPALREALLEAQLELREGGRFAVVVVVGGVDGAGKGETINLLNAWMDPRLIEVHGIGQPTQEERERPVMWRFWRALPPKGKLGIFFGSWYTQPILARVLEDAGRLEVERAIERIRNFEQMLTDEGVLIVKFWFHLAKSVQKRRLKALESDPKTRWRVTEQDWKNFRKYDEFRRTSEHVLRETSTGSAPWFVVEGADARYRGLTVGKVLLEALRKRLDQVSTPVAVVDVPPATPVIDGLTVLRALDLSQAMQKKKYEEALEHYQGKLNLLTRDPRFQEVAVVAAFEGSDAAGKGGTIRRITAALDCRHYDIIPVASPTEEERAQPYLWRFWRHVPRRGRVTIFDRTWYGRVLVERVEGYCAEADWMRAYSEINDFEEQLVEAGVVVLKFWLTISKEEQLRRFQEREQTGFKRYKITPEDWRNREKWEAYEAAVCDMVDRTSSDLARWTLVEANDKYFARIKVLKTLCEGIENALDNRRRA